MLKQLLAFFVMFGIFFFAIDAIRGATGKEQWKLIKMSTYVIICALLAWSTLGIIVILF